MKQIKLILISQDVEFFRDLKDALEDDESLHVTATDSTEQVLAAAEKSEVDVVIVDDQLKGIGGLDFIKKLVRRNPFVNCALVSSLHPSEFHAATEGLGVFLRLPGRLGPQESGDISAQICAHLEKIYGLISSSFTTQRESS
jgi:CheY-like chemotaxis protein